MAVEALLGLVSTMSAPFGELFARYGYAVVGVGVFLENMGVPVPGETVLLAAGFFAQQEHSAQERHFALPWVISIATVAAILGDNMGFWLGRRFGRRIFAWGTQSRIGRLLMLTPERLAWLDTYFHRHGAKTVFFARFVTGVRVFAALFAGTSGFRWRRFLVYQAAGAVVWATTIAIVGYLCGTSWDLLKARVEGAGWILLGVVALLALALAHRSRRSKSSI